MRIGNDEMLLRKEKCIALTATTTATTVCMSKLLHQNKDNVLR
jgi:hypothetical protein